MNRLIIALSVAAILDVACVADSRIESELETFESAAPVWPEGQSAASNVFVRFAAKFDYDGGECPLLRLTASTVYRANLNGRIVGYGPARAVKGVFRVDEWPLRDVRVGENELTVEAYPWCSEWWCADCDASRKLLSRHRNAVAICGHAHSNVLNERNFWRGEFTAVEVPSLSQLAYPRASGIDRSKADETSAQCLIMSVWPHSVAFERLDARIDKSIAPDWTARI